MSLLKTYRGRKQRPSPLFEEIGNKVVIKVIIQKKCIFVFIFKNQMNVINLSMF